MQKKIPKPKIQKRSYVLDKAQNTPLYLQLYQQIRDAIHSQQLQRGDKLPSKRSLREHLQISQNTIESAYSQLLAEGYIESLPRQGFFVCYQADLQFSLAKNIEKNPPHFAQNQREPKAPLAKIKFDFNPNHIDQTYFPFKAWQKAGRLNRHLQFESLILGDRQGDWNLRYQIAEYLSASRGVQCAPEQIVICAGVENAMQQLILLFNQCYPTINFTYAMEFHGYVTIEKLLQLYQKKITKLPINEDGLNLDKLTQSDINIAYLTPSHLYPFGQVLSIGQRQQLLEWANQKDERYILEDDYDSEFRYKGKPIPALQSLDIHQKVIYFGSFSKLLSPALRIGFMVLPPQLLAKYQQFCGFFNCAVPRFEQQRLANFIQQGEFEKHIHRMRKIYRHKMEMLCELFSPYKEKIRYYGEHSGLYLLIELINDARSIEQICQLAQQQQIALYSVPDPNRKLFAIGFGLPLTELKTGGEILLRILLDQ